MDDTTPLVYQIKLQVAGHDFTSSLVQPIDSYGRNVTPPGSANANPRQLPQSTIYGFNGTFPGPRINAEYGRPAIVRFENHLDVDNGFDRQDFGAPNHSFLTHLHNGHTASGVRRQPAPRPPSLQPARARRRTRRPTSPASGWTTCTSTTRRAATTARSSRSCGSTTTCTATPAPTSTRAWSASCRIYDPQARTRATRPTPTGSRLPGRRTDHRTAPSTSSTTSRWRFYDCRLDDGVTPHKDAHNGNGETHPEWWGKTFFRHFPNHGFVGDIFTVNGTAYPVLEVKRRKYRLRFLDASISRIYDFKLMRSSRRPEGAPAILGYSGDELQGQYRLPDGQQCMKFVQIANEGGLLPKPIVRDYFELWPAKRREFVVDFTKYMDGTPTKKGDVIYLVNTMKMTTGRMWDSDGPQLQGPGHEDRHRRRPARAGLQPHPGEAARRVPDLVPGRASPRRQGQEHPDVRAPARQHQRRPRDRVADQRACRSTRPSR